MKFAIRSRWTNEVKFEIELAAEFETKPPSVQKGAAIKAALAAGKDLSGSDLRDSHLSGSDLRGSDLRGSDLSDSDLSGSDLSDSDLSGSDLRGSDLSGSDLSDSNLRGSDLSDSDLSGSDLSGSDLSDLLPLIAVPSLNRKILAAIEAGGELQMQNWHSCETTHCRAGWAVHLAGPAAKVLEHCYGPSVAGTLVYLASCPFLEGKTPNFFASNTEAMDDIRRCAELEPEVEQPVA